MTRQPYPAWLSMGTMTASTSTPVDGLSLLKRQMRTDPEIERIIFDAAKDVLRDASFLQELDRALCERQIQDRRSSSSNSQGFR